MAVEIYLEPEVQELAQSKELTEQWKNQCIELGLEGQLSMLNKDSENAKPSPYVFMNNGLCNLFATLCPAVVDYKKYNKSTIPMEVLGQIALCEKNKYFHSIKIWYDDVDPDPVVVGYIKDGAYDYTKHLIARFGDEVLPLEVLRDKARGRLKKLISNEATSIINTVDNAVDSILSGSNSVGFTVSPTGWSHNKGD